MEHPKFEIKNKSEIEIPKSEIKKYVKQGSSKFLLVKQVY